MFRLQRRDTHLHNSIGISHSSEEKKIAAAYSKIWLSRTQKFRQRDVPQGFQGI